MLGQMKMKIMTKSKKIKTNEENNIKQDFKDKLSSSSKTSTFFSADWSSPAGKKIACIKSYSVYV